MKRELRLGMIGLLLLAGGFGAYVASPALRASVSRESRSLLGWTEAARQADPSGFTAYVEGRLAADLGKLKSTRVELANEVGALAKKEKQQHKLLAHAEQFAEEFRMVYQKAEAEQAFPVSVRNAEYTEHEVVRQVSLMLAEAEGYRQSLSKLKNVRDKAERRLEELTVRISSTEAQLAATATQRGLLRARVLTNEGESLVAQVDELLDENDVVIHSNPVRSVPELLVSSEPSNRQPSLDVARQFLASPTQTIAVEIAQDVDAPRESATGKERNKRQEPKPSSAPIFQQQ